MRPEWMDVPANLPRRVVVCAFCDLRISRNGVLINSCHRLRLTATDGAEVEVAVCANCEQRGVRRA